MSNRIDDKVNELVKLIMIPGGTNILYEALQDFRIKAGKEEQWDIFLMPVREMEDIIFEIMMIQKGDA